MMDPNIATLLNEQIGLEHSAVLLYAAISNAASRAWPGFEKWARRESAEEFGHWTAFQEYMNDRGVRPTVIDLSPPSEASQIEGLKLSPLGWIEAALGTERLVYAHLTAINSSAEGDPDITRFLLPYHAIQTESINALEVLQARLTEATGDVAAWQAIDRELGE